MWMSNLVRTTRFLKTFIRYANDETIGKPDDLKV